MKKIKLLKHQGQFIQAPFLFIKHRFFILCCGYGAGKSSAICKVVLHYVKILQGKTDTEGHSPVICLGGVTLSHLEKTTLAMIKEDLDASKTVYRHDTKNNTIFIGNVRIILVSLSEPSKIVGFNAYISVGDEIDDLGTSTSDDLTFEAVKALNERTRQVIKGLRKPALLFASTSQGQKGLYRVYTQFIKTGAAFILIRGSTRDNPHLDPEYVESLYKMYNEVERKVFLEGYFLPISTGRVFGDFDWGRNFIHVDMDQEIGPDETVYWAQDFNTGYFRGCTGVERGGRIYVVKGYDFPDIREAPAVVRHDFPHNKIVWIPDTTAKDQISHFTKELRKHRIHWIQRGKNPLVEDSAFLVNKLFFTKRLFFTAMAKDVAEACALAQRDKNGKIPKGIGPNSPIHYCFAGHTKVTTARGQVRIDRVRVGDEVLTRAGWKKVEVSAYMGKQKTRQLGLTRITPEHPVWTEERGMTPAYSLTDSERLLTMTKEDIKQWQKTKRQEDLLQGVTDEMSRLLSSLAERGTATQTREAGLTGTISEVARYSFTFLLGNITTDLYQKVMKSITKTGILHTTKKGILNVFLRSYTRSFQNALTLRKQEKILTESDPSPQLGTAAKKADNGILRMARKWLRVTQVKLYSKSVDIAVAATQHSRSKPPSAGSVPPFVRTRVDTIQTWTWKHGPVSFAEKLFRHTKERLLYAAQAVVPRLTGGKSVEKVYDISVEGQHEFIADGILVSNCDGVRMLSYFLASNKRSLRDIRRVTIARHLEMYEEEAAITELDGGYRELNPEAL